MKVFVFSLVIAGIFMAGVGLTFFLLRSSPPSSTTGNTAVVKPVVSDARASGFQAVFLDNGQVYFGRLSGFGGERPTLREIYYLRLPASLQSSAAVTDVNNRTPLTAVGSAASPQPELTLTKLGNELHGPVDEMKLNPNHIIFVEDLRRDGKIALAIEQYRSQKK